MPVLKDYDPQAMRLGMIQAFCEVVMQGVKDLAFSPIMDPAEWERLQEDAETLARHFKVKSFVETDLISSDLVPDSAVKGKVVVLYYKEEAVIEAYRALKASVQEQESRGSYDEVARRTASIRLRRLLSYSEKAIQEIYRSGWQVPFLMDNCR